MGQLTLDVPCPNPHTLRMVWLLMSSLLSSALLAACLPSSPISDAGRPPTADGTYDLAVTGNDEDRGTLYLNGTAEATIRTHVRPPVGGAFIVGAEDDRDPTSLWQGRLDEAAVCDHGSRRSKFTRIMPPVDRCTAPIGGAITQVRPRPGLCLAITTCSRSLRARITPSRLDRWTGASVRSVVLTLEFSDGAASSC
jgi:hypothetical protein